MSKYRKIHLVDVDVSVKQKPIGIYNESGAIVRGNSLTQPIVSPVGYLGLSISFDIRFPEMYRELALKGAQVLLVPS